MKIKQSVINTFNRQNIPYERLLEKDEDVVVQNWITGATCGTTPLISYLIHWVYNKQLGFERGENIRLDDFDRVRYFILEQDKNAYMTCID